MATNKFSRFWTLLIFFLIAVIVASGVIVWLRYDRGQPVLISQSPTQELRGEIYISGTVKNPGLYPLTDGDNVPDLIRAAGGTNGNADLSHIKLYIPEAGKQEPQKIDINRAELWLLEALPGIAETRARAIITYREQYGPFHNISELTKVEGIGASIYEQIKELVTVSD